MASDVTGGLLTLDIAPGITGWAYGDVSGKLPTRHHFWRMPEVGGEGAIYTAFANKLWDSIDKFRPTWLVIENPLPPQSPKVLRNPPIETFKIYGMRAYCWEAGERHDVSVRGVNVNEVRSKLIGRCRWPGGRNEAKQAVIRYVRSLGLDVANDDQADAIMVWLFYSAELKRAWSNSSLREAAD